MGKGAVVGSALLEGSMGWFGETLGDTFGDTLGGAIGTAFGTGAGVRLGVMLGSVISRGRKRKFGGGVSSVTVSEVAGIVGTRRSASRGPYFVSLGACSTLGSKGAGAIAGISTTALGWSDGSVTISTLCTVGGSGGA